MALFVYITTSSPEEAERIATDLVEQRLAACVNILAPITSVYQWEGRMCSEQEIPLIAKTEDDRFEALAARVRAAQVHDSVYCCAASCAGNSRFFRVDSSINTFGGINVSLCCRFHGF